MNTTIRLIFAAALLAAAGLAANAQISVQAGVLAPHQKMTHHDSFKRTDRYGYGAYVGADYDIHIIKGFLITPGIYYNYTFSEYINNDPYNFIHFDQIDHLIKIPVHLKYNFNIKPGKFAIYLYAGPVFSVGLASQLNTLCKAIIDDVAGDIIHIDNYSGAIKKIQLANYGDYRTMIIDMVQASIDSKGITQRYLDLQIDGGIGFRFKDHWELRFGYSFGVFDRFNRAYGDTHDLKMTQYYVGFGYRF